MILVVVAGCSTSCFFVGGTVAHVLGISEPFPLSADCKFFRLKTPKFITIGVFELLSTRLHAQKAHRCETICATVLLLIVGIERAHSDLLTLLFLLN